MTEAKARGAAGLVWMAFLAGEVRSPVQQHLSEDELAAIGGATGAGEGDLVLIVADQPSTACTSPSTGCAGCSPIGWA